MITDNVPTDYATVLHSFGTEMVSDGSVAFADFAKAENAYVHHTAVPAAVTAFATISPCFARGRFPDVTLADVVQKRGHMDRSEAAALAAVCGEFIPSEPDPDARDFIAHLLDVIDRQGLDAFYGRYPEHPACFGIDVRPHGIDWETHEANEAGLRVWREAYRNLETSKQMIVATIMWLYVGRQECGWLRHLRHRWHAAPSPRCRRPAPSATGRSSWRSIRAGDRRYAP
jgi:hypothetical protein